MSSILIVDDVKSARPPLSQMIATMGYGVTSVANTKMALRQLAAGEFDLIVLDLDLPTRDDLDILRQIEALRPDIPLIVVSAHGTIQNAVEAMKLGALDFISKPFTPEKIQNLVGQLLDRKHVEAARLSDYQAHLKLARRCVKEQHFEAAMEHIHKALTANPCGSEAFNLLGVLEELRGNDTEAMKNYRVALDFDPTYTPAQENLTRAGKLTGVHRTPNLG